MKKVEKVGFLLRINPKVKEELEKIAIEQDISLNLLMNQALKDFVRKNNVEENINS